MVVLCFGDIFAKPGRQAVRDTLPSLKSKYSPDFILGNVENLAGGKGVNKKTIGELLDLGFDAFTSGNHIWDNKEVYDILRTERRLLRPANYPDAPGERAPGHGFGLFRKGNHELFVINVMGRIFMDPLDCPFASVERILQANPTTAPILVDMHGEASSEKAAMGWYLDGRVAAVVGTHTHVQTADEQILPKGTAFITDIGMTGSFHSCIGMNPPPVVRKFLTKRHQPFQPGADNPGVGCVVLDIAKDNSTTSIERIRYTVSEMPR